MRKRRGIGLWLISLYWFTRSGLVVYLVHGARANPATDIGTFKLINFLGPFMWIAAPKSPLCLIIAPVSVAVGVGIGVGLLFYQRWALTMAALDRIVPLIKLMVFYPLVYKLDHGAFLNLILSSHLATADILFVLFMALYLFQPDVRRQFGIS
jgi:hypothetical protein